MGTSASGSGFRATSDPDRADAVVLLEGAAFESSLESDGWAWWHHPEGGEFEFGIHEFVDRISKAAKCPAFGGWVFDSNLAVIAGAESDGPGFRLAVNDTLSFAEEDENAAEWAETTSSVEAIRESAEALAKWSRHAPQTVDAAAIIDWTPSVAVLKPRDTEKVRPPSEPVRSDLFFGGPNPWITYEDEAGWGFAEDGVRLVFSLLGFPAFDQVAHPESEDDLAVEPEPRKLSDDEKVLRERAGRSYDSQEWDEWKSDDRFEWWRSLERELGWATTNRTWGYEGDVMLGRREFAPLPQPAVKGEVRLVYGSR